MVMLTFIVLALAAIIVSMSNARSGTIHLSTGTFGRPVIGIPGRFVFPAFSCSAPGAICGPKGHAKRSRGSGTVLLPSEIAIGVLLATGTVFFLWMARRGQPPEESSLASEEALSFPPKTRRRPANPREAVLAAFADLEDRLAGLGFTREPWEAAESYLARVLPDAWREGRAARRLAQLYALARYSHHPIDGAAATNAIAASKELSGSADSLQRGAN
jgi:hypothetical protein